MKHYNKTLLELDHKVHLSQVGACASCHAAEFHGTKEYAKASVAKHRAISRDVRQSISELLKQLDWFDVEVERSHQKVAALRLSDKVELPQGATETSLPELAQQVAEQAKTEAELRTKLRRAVSLLTHADDYLRAIRSEDLDGSEHALGDLLVDTEAYLRDDVP